MPDRRAFRVLDLFSGIGGFSLGLERTGHFNTVAFCERNPYCQRVLKKHWPTVQIFEDIRFVGERELEPLLPIDVITGGFPCQDISYANQMARGLDGSQSALYWEMYRIIRMVRPRWIIMENVPALLRRGMSEVLGSLAEIGYDAEWDCLPAAAFGAPHLRDRVFIVAYPSSLLPERRRGGGEVAGSPGEVAGTEKKRKRLRNALGGSCAAAPDAECDRLQRILRPRTASGHAPRSFAEWWAAEPDVGRVADGVSHRMDRLRALGNAVVPQIVEYIGRCILEADSDP
jgi:DNA (cytosine-5)-methyltransferase 1